MVDLVDCTIQTYSPRIEPLLPVKRLYLFQPSVLSDVHVITRILLALPVVNHLAKCVVFASDCGVQIVLGYSYGERTRDSGITSWHRWKSWHFEVISVESTTAK